MHEIIESLTTALDRIEDFEAVQADAALEYRVEAVKLLQSAVGIEDETRRLLAARVEQLSPDSQPGQVLLGVIVGLLAAQFQAERESGPGRGPR